MQWRSAWVLTQYRPHHTFLFKLNRKIDNLFEYSSSTISSSSSPFLPLIIILVGIRLCILIVGCKSVGHVLLSITLPLQKKGRLRMLLDWRSWRRATKRVINIMGRWSRICGRCTTTHSATTRMTMDMERVKRNWVWGTRSYVRGIWREIGHVWLPWVRALTTREGYYHTD